MKLALHTFFLNVISIFRPSSISLTHHMHALSHKGLVQNHHCRWFAVDIYCCLYLVVNFCSIYTSECYLPTTNAPKQLTQSCPTWRISSPCSHWWSKSVVLLYLLNLQLYLFNSRFFLQFCTTHSTQFLPLSINWGELGRAWASPTLALAYSVTALHTCVCMCLRPYTENFKWARWNFNFTKIELGVLMCDACAAWRHR